MGQYFVQLFFGERIYNPLDPTQGKIIHKIDLLASFYILQAVVAQGIDFDGKGFIILGGNLF